MDKLEYTKRENAKKLNEWVEGDVKQRLEMTLTLNKTRQAVDSAPPTEGDSEHAAANNRTGSSFSVMPKRMSNPAGNGKKTKRLTRGPRAPLSQSFPPSPSFSRL